MLHRFAPPRFCFSLLFTVVALFAFAITAAERRPNVIIIFSDDQGTVDMNCYGATDLTTPNMDALAQRGVRFTQFYAGAPVCSPSRASLLTGRNPHRAGVPGNVSSQPGGKSGMSPEQITIAEMLKEAGYATGHVGKWHLGYVPEMMPRAQGFDYTFGHMGGCIDNYSHFFFWNGPNRHDLWRQGEEVHRPGEFFGDLMVEEANGFIEKNRDRPFFLYWAINMPHYPYQGDVKWLEHYADLEYPRNLYAAFLSTVDQRIGQVVAKVEELGLSDDTIIIFQSDHGHSAEVRAHGGGGSAGPHRGAKFSLLEGGIRVPAIISWPGTLPEGEVRDQVAWSCDWMQTIAMLCDAELPRRTLDGEDLGDVIRSASAPTPHDVLHWASGPQWAVRKGPWKLYCPNIKQGHVQLYNIPEDPGESKNLVAAEPATVEELKQLHDQWMKTRMD